MFVSKLKNRSGSQSVQVIQKLNGVLYTLWSELSKRFSSL